MHKLMRYIKGYEKQALLAPLFKMLEACFELFVPLVIASIIDTGIKNEDAAFIWTRCGLLVLLAAIGLASSLTAQWFSATAALRRLARRRSEGVQAPRVGPPPRSGPPERRAAP